MLWCLAQHIYVAHWCVLGVLHCGIVISNFFFPLGVLISPTNPGHFNQIEIYTDHAITAAMELMQPGLILIAVLAGSDYNVHILQ